MSMVRPRLLSNSSPKTCAPTWSEPGCARTNISPGFSSGSEFWNVRLRGNDEAAAKVHAGTVPLTTADIAEAAYWVATLPAHVNINFLEMMPTCQGYGALNIKRNPAV